MKKPFVHILLIIAVGLLAYSNTFYVSFHFDDSQNIVENPVVKNLEYFADPIKAQGLNIYPALKSRFIGYFTFALNYRLHGLNVIGYHIVNLAIHILNALLVYWLVLLTFQTPYFSRIAEFPHPPFSKGGRGGIFANRKHHEIFIALFSSLLFVSHPIQTQAVTYIVQRLASLATMFYLLSLTAYIRWRVSLFQTRNPELETRGPKPAVTRLTSAFWYLASLFSAVLAMKTKEIAFTLPVIIVLYEFMFFEGTIKKRVLWLIPLLLTMLIIPLSLISVDKPIGEIVSDVSEATRLQSPLSRWDYLFTQFRVIVTYIRLIFLPIYQNLDYDYPARHSFFEPAVFLSFLFLLSILGLGIYFLYRSRLAPSASRLAAFGIFWFFITLTVESSIIPIVDVIFEHRVYLPLAGALIAITTSAFIIANKLKNLWALGGKAVFGVLVLTVIVLVVATHARNIVWQDDLTLWEDAAKKSPGKPRVHNSLGFAYATKGLKDDAIKHYKIALELAPNYAGAHNNIGVAYASIGLSDIAIDHYRIALRLIKPDYVEDAHFNFAMQHLNKGDIDNARKIFEARVHNNLGLAYVAKGLRDDAIKHYKIALELAPDFAEAHNNIGVAYILSGLSDIAVDHYRIALRLKPDYVDAHFNLAMQYLNKGDLDNARKIFEAMLQISPYNSQALHFLNYIANRQASSR